MNTLQESSTSTTSKPSVGILKYLNSVDHLCSAARTANESRARCASISTKRIRIPPLKLDGNFEEASREQLLSPVSELWHRSDGECVVTPTRDSERFWHTVIGKSPNYGNYEHRATNGDAESIVSPTSTNVASAEYGRRLGKRSRELSCTVHKKSGEMDAEHGGALDMLLLQSDTEQICLMCDASFERKKEMTEHFRNMHRGVKRYACPTCGLRFSQRGGVGNHVRTVHERLRPFGCSECGRRYASRGDVTRHEKSVHEKARPFKCECGSSFARKSVLVRHRMNVHRSSVE